MRRDRSSICACPALSAATQTAHLRLTDGVDMYSRLSGGGRSVQRRHPPPDCFLESTWYLLSRCACARGGGGQRAHANHARGVAFDNNNHNVEIRIYIRPYRLRRCIIELTLPYLRSFVFVSGKQKLAEKTVSNCSGTLYGHHANRARAHHRNVSPPATCWQNGPLCEYHFFATLE